MKLIIDISEENYKNLFAYAQVYKSHYADMIRNGKPYEETTSGDLISRRVLKDLISDKSIPIKFEEEKRGEWQNSSGVLLSDIYKIIDNAPTVITDSLYEAYCKMNDEEFEHTESFTVKTPKGKIVKFVKERPQGEWIEHTERITLDTYYECSNCKEPWTTIEGTPWQNGMNFCPNCGARMGADMRGGGGDD